MSGGFAAQIPGHISEIWLTAVNAKPGHISVQDMGSLTKCVPEIRGWAQKIITFYVLLRFTAQGCLWSLKLLKKCKVQAICDLSYAAWFCRGRSESKVMAGQTSQSARGKSFAPNEPFEEYLYNVDEKKLIILSVTSPYPLPTCLNGLTHTIVSLLRYLK